MKKQYWFPFILGITFFSFCVTGFCQVNEDSVMMANSERWDVKQHKGLFGLCKPEFGNFTTLDVVKVDSAVIRKRHKDSSNLGFHLSGGDFGIDNDKFVTNEKTKFYKLRIISGNDISEAVFSIYSVSKEKKQTFLGKMLSKKSEEEKDIVLHYNRDVEGIILPDTTSKKWEFVINDFTSGSRIIAGSASPASMSGGYIKNENDSLYLNAYSSITSDLILINTRGEYIAALKFKRKPLYIWIRNDIESSYRKAIASLFAVIIGIKDL